jgi:hypothetical protein
MRHIRPIGRTPQLAATSLLESLILLVFTSAFQEYQNFQQVFQNLQKFYQKT